MLRILHTADWHIGQKFFGYDRTNEHAVVLRQIEKIILSEKVDVLLISGDLFDTINPSAEAQKLFLDFCAHIIKDSTGLQVVIIAGNHDSALRLKAYEDLLKILGVHIVSSVCNINGIPQYSDLIIPLGKVDSPEAICIAVPYLRSHNLPRENSLEESYKTFFQEAFEEASKRSLPIILMAHLAVSGSQYASINSSFSPIMGLMESVSPMIFPTDANYIALGHIHRKQQLSKDPLIYYAGSPLPLSFTEKKYEHGMLLIELEGKETKVKEISLHPPVQLRIIKGSEEKIREEIALLPDGRVTEYSPYLSIVLECDTPRPDLLEDFREITKKKSIRLTTIRRDVVSTNRVNIANEQPISFSDLTPIDIAKRYYREQSQGDEMPKELKKIFSQVVEEVIYEDH